MYSSTYPFPTSISLNGTASSTDARVFVIGISEMACNAQVPLSSGGEAVLAVLVPPTLSSHTPPGRPLGRVLRVPAAVHIHSLNNHFILY